MGRMLSPLQVPTPVRLRLGHACLQHLADGAGARVLHVKGVALHPSLAQDRAPSSDCDVLVHPHDVHAFVGALASAGWERITRFEHGSVFGHAATYYDPAWGTVDVHRAFPGLDRDPVAAFEEMWSRRQWQELGGAVCAVPDLAAQRLVLLVHAARDQSGMRDHDVQVSWQDVPVAEREEIDALAERLGARVPVAFATGRPHRATGQPGRHLWQAAFEGADATWIWRARLRDAQGAAKLRLLMRAMRPNPDHLALRLGHAPSRREMRREWWERWGRGVNRLRGRG